MSGYLTPELLKAAGIALVCSLCAVILGRSNGVTFAVRMGGAVLIFSIFLSLLGTLIEALGNIFARFEGQEYAQGAFSLMLKALGIALISKLCGDLCRDCGENSLADGVDSVGRIAVISLCIPVIADILEYATRFLEKS